MMNAYILRIKEKHWFYNEHSKDIEKFYEVEVLGREMPAKELPKRDTSRKAEEGR